MFKFRELVPNEHRHFHPSGIPEPSKEDFAITERVEKAADLIGIELCDHVIIGREGYYSFREKKQMKHEI